MLRGMRLDRIRGGSRLYAALLVEAALFGVEEID